MSLLACFNYISEDESARKILYNVCRFNRSKHFIKKTTGYTDTKTALEEACPDEVLEQDNLNFNERFGTYEDFDNLFE